MSLQIGLRRAGLAAFFALLALFLCHSWYGPDIWYHLTWGRSLFATGRFSPQPQTLIEQPIFANIYWLFQGLMFLSYRSGGLYLVSALFGVAWLAITVLWLKLSGLARHPLGLVVALGFFICCQLRFEQRPEVFSYLMLMIFLWRLSALDPKQPVKTSELALLFVLQALWTGLHSYFALGPMLALAYVVASRRRQALPIFVVTLLGTFASPFGWTVWETVWAYSKVGAQLKDLNQELFTPSLLPLYWPTSVFWLMWLATVILCARALWPRRWFCFPVVVALGGILLSAQAVRNIPLLVLMSAPLWASLPSGRAWLKLQPALDALALALIAVMAMGCVTGRYYQEVGSLATFGVHEDWASYPIGAAEFLRARGFHGRIFCDSYDGGYLEFALPDVQVAGDSYFSDPDITRAYFAAIRDPSELARLNERVHFEALLINVENLQEIDALLNDPRWALVYNDSHRAVFFAQPATASDPALASYWHGETLRHWTYAFGPISWAAIARKENWPSVLAKILQDVESSPEIPSALLRQVLAYAVVHKDRALVASAMALTPRRYGGDHAEQRVLSELMNQAKTCCP